MNPSPKQLDQQRRFTRMVRERARFERQNPGICYYCGARAGRTKGAAHAKGCSRYQGRQGNPDVVRTAKTACSNCGGKKLLVRKGITSCASCGMWRNPARRQNPLTEYVLAPIGTAIGSSVVSAFSKKRAHRATNPRSEHVRGLPAKYQRMYEQMITSPASIRRYGSRVKEVAARTAWARYEAANKPKRNPSTEGRARANFQEFRGKPVSGEYEIATPAGTPKLLTEMGRLEEITGTNGAVYRFDLSVRLLQDNRHRLHIGGDVRLGVKNHQPGYEYDLGPMKSIVYWADKPHLPGGKTNRPYVHKFSDPLPHLVIDRAGRPRIEGGGYTVTADGIEG